MSTATTDAAPAAPARISDPLLEGAQVALAAAEAAGALTAEIATDPIVRAGGAIAAALARIIAGIIERHGAAGAVAAKELLEQLHAAGPQGVTGAQLDVDDARLMEEIRGWYARSRPPENPFGLAPTDHPLGLALDGGKP